MVTLANRPKNTLFFIANDEKDFLRVQEGWQRNGWLITSDFKDNTYEAIGFVNGQVICLLYEMPKDVPQPQEPTPQEDPNVKNIEVSVDQEGAEAEAAAIDQLTSTS